MEPKDNYGETASSETTSRKKKPRQTASANPVSPDDLFGDAPPSERDDSWVGPIGAFVVGLLAGLIAGILIGRD